MVLNGSIRDDGPLPEVFEHTYVGQDAKSLGIETLTDRELSLIKEKWK